jgi:hypothetical protein
VLPKPVKSAVAGDAAIEIAAVRDATAVMDAARGRLRMGRSLENGIRSRIVCRHRRVE